MVRIKDSISTLLIKPAHINIHVVNIATAILTNFYISLDFILLLYIDDFHPSAQLSPCSTPVHFGRVEIV